MKSVRRWAIPVVVILLLGLGGAAAWLLLRPSSGTGFLPLVQITDPRSGEMVELGRPLTVQASAEGSESFVRLELYSDGALVAVEDSTLEGGSNPLILLQNYTPRTPGRHVLMARGYVEDGSFSDSSVVSLDVVEPSAASRTITVDTIPLSDGVLPSLIGVATLYGVPPDQLQEANPGLEGVDPALPLPPGTSLLIPPQPISPAPGDDSPSISPSASAPSAPSGLGLTLDCATAQLSWTDTTVDETGFVVYRLGPGDTRLTPAATLPADATTFSDPLEVPGIYRYQVAALRGRAEGLGLMRSASTPDSCAAPAGSIETVVLSVLSLETADTYDGVYCYFDTNGSGFQRAPAGDFTYFKPEADGLTYNLSRQLPNHGQFVLAVPEGGGDLTLGGECWGQRGPISTAVGLPFSASHSRSDWDGRDLIQTAMDARGQTVAVLPPFSGGYQLRLRYRLSANTPAARSAAVASQFDLSGLDPSAARSILAPAYPEILYGSSVFNPPINLRVQWYHDAHLCDQFPAGSIARWDCAAHNLEGAYTLFWDWDPSELVPESALTQYEITMIFHNPDGSQSFSNTPGWIMTRQGTGPIQRRVALTLPGVRASAYPCGTRIELMVQAFTATLASPTGGPSTWMVTEPCPGTTVQPQVRITFSSLAIGHVTEPEPFGLTTGALELTGSLGVNNHARWLVHSTNINDDYWVDAGFGTQTLPDPAFILTQPDPFASIRPSRFDSGPVFYFYPTETNQRITIWSDLYDVDPSWLAIGRNPLDAYTGACGGRVQLGPFTTEEWRTLNRTIPLSGNIPSEPCTITITVVGGLRGE